MSRPCILRPTLIFVALCAFSTAPVFAVSILGKVITASGKPLAFANVYLLNLYSIPLSNQPMPQTLVTTDSAGRFILSVPDGAVVIGKANNLTGCFVLPEDARDWRLTVRSSPLTTLTFSSTDLSSRYEAMCKVNLVYVGGELTLNIVTPDVSTVSINLSGPDCAPLRHQATELVNTADIWPYGSSNVVYNGHTDGKGVVRVRCFPGQQYLQFLAPGVGFGSTGSIEPTDGRDGSVVIPPLCAFATISGTVSKNYFGSGTRVVSSTQYQTFSWQIPAASIDRNGNFTLSDVLPGENTVQLISGVSGTSNIGLGESVLPGESITGVNLGGILYGPSGPPHVYLRSEGIDTILASPLSSKAHVEGRLTDANGRPISGADVYTEGEASDFHGSIVSVFTGITDSDGQYDIDVIHNDEFFAPKVTAYFPGHAITEADSVQVNPVTGAPSNSELHYHADIILPGLGGSLNVRVLNHGKPVANAAVRLKKLYQSEWDPIGTSYLPKVPTASVVELSSLLMPIAITGSDGVARFTNLRPGIYQVAAGETDKAGIIKAVRDLFFGMPQFPFNIATGIAVRDSETTDFSVGLPGIDALVSFSLMLPSGIAESNSDLRSTCSYGSSTLDCGVGTQMVSPGKFQDYVNSPGIWNIGVSFSDSSGFPLTESEPNTGAQSVFAVASEINPYIPNLLHTVHRNPGSIAVDLRNEQGKPVAGAVFITGFGLPSNFGLSVGADGHGVFPDMPSGTYKLAATIYGQQEEFTQPFSNPPTKNEPIPWRILDQTVEVAGDNETKVLFQPLQPGYISGKLVLSSPKDASNYSVDWPKVDGFGELTTSSSKSPLLWGPFPPGNITGALMSKDGQTVVGVVNTVVTAGVVTDISIKPNAKTSVPFNPYGVTVPDDLQQVNGYQSVPLAGTVVMSDNSTPADGAIIQTLTPVDISSGGTTDAGGVILANRWEDFDERPRHDPVGTPATTVVAALLPGTCGAAIVPYDQSTPLRLVLPSPISLVGRVTVGGQAVDDQPGRYLVRAEYQGLGSLDDFLSVEASAQADGSFQLPGLTPGNYIIQAARDGVWLSNSVAFTASARNQRTELNLDILKPGAPMLLHVADGNGNALVDTPVSFDAPPGPLETTDWSNSFRTDGIGDLRFDGFTAGEQTIHFDGLSYSFDVPEYKDQTKPVEVDVRLH